MSDTAKYGKRYSRTKIVELYQSGLSVPEIARRAKCHKATVYNHLTAAGVPRRDDRHTLPGAPKQNEICRNGHKRTKENTRVRPDGTNDCLDCQRARDRRKSADRIIQQFVTEQGS